MKRTMILMAACCLIIQSSFAATPNNNEDPAELQRLRKTYMQRKAAAIKPLTQQYVRDLNRLKKRYTNRRDYDKADQVDHEIARVSIQREEPLEEVVLLAKEARLTGGDIVYQVNEKCIGYWSKVENKVSWQIESIKPGYYEVSMLYSCGSDGGGDMRVTAGNAKLKARVKPTGSWVIFDKKTLGRIEIEEENLTLTLQARRKPGKYFMNLKNIMLRPISR